MRAGRVLTDAEIATMRAELADVTTLPPLDRPWWDVFNIAATIEELQKRAEFWEMSCHEMRGQRDEEREVLEEGYHLLDAITYWKRHNNIDPSWWASAEKWVADNKLLMADPNVEEGS